MITTHLHEITPLTQIGEAWAFGEIQADTVWLTEHRGKLSWSVDVPPANPWGRVVRQPSLELLEEPTERTIVIEWPSGRHALYLPESHRTAAPYTGRQHETNVDDCYTLARDWFARERGVLLPKLFADPRDPNFDWFDTHPETENWERVVVGQPGDGILFTIGTERRHPDHCGVLLENGLMLHHMFDRLSTIEPLSAAWRRKVTCYVRHK